MAKTTAAWAICAAFTLAAGTSEATKPAAFTVVAGDGRMAAGLFTAGERGAVFDGPGGSRLELSPGAELRFFNVPQMLQLKPGPQTKTHTMLLASGRMEVQVPEQGAKREAVLVSFQRKLMAIATGGTLVAVATPKVSAVANAGGEVLSSWGAAFVPLELGRVRRMAPGVETEGDVPVAPSWEPGRRVWIAVHGTEAIEDLSWKPVAEAARYQVELRRDGEQVPFATQDTVTQHMESRFPGLGPGIYYASVRAFDAYGIGGKASKPERLHVLGVTLPPGSFATDDGSVLLAPGQQAQFSHADGLLMSYLGATRYYPANTAVGLYRNERTVVHFRAPDTDQFASIPLEPRKLRAKVFVGPKIAIWPIDEVVIRVRLQNADDARMDDNVQIVPEVTLGIDRLELDWHREGSELVAKVPPARTPGPWVLRVDIKDQFGLPLGSDFLEIVGQPAKRRAAKRMQASAKKSRG